MIRHRSVDRARTVERLSQLGTVKAKGVTKNTIVEYQSTRGILPPKGSPPGTSISLPSPSPPNFKAGEPPAFNEATRYEGGSRTRTSSPLTNRSFSDFHYAMGANTGDEQKKATEGLRPFIPSDDHQLARYERFQDNMRVFRKHELF